MKKFLIPTLLAIFLPVFVFANSTTIDGLLDTLIEKRLELKILQTENQLGARTDTSSGGGASAFEDLTGVSVSSETTGEMLHYDGSNWVNSSTTPGEYAIAKSSSQAFRVCDDDKASCLFTVNTTGNEVEIASGVNLRINNFSGLRLQNQYTGDNYVTLSLVGQNGANRSLTIDQGTGNRTVEFNSNVEFNQSLETSDSPTFAGADLSSGLTTVDNVTGTTVNIDSGNALSLNTDSNQNIITGSGNLGVNSSTPNYSLSVGDYFGFDTTDANPQLLAPTGTASRPGLSFMGREDSGVFIGAFNMGFRVNGQDVFRVFDSGSFSLFGNIQQTQGADVASGNDITLGGDGNYFDITGTTQVNTIASTNFKAGSFVVLQFDGSVTVKHDTAGSGLPLQLSGSSDFSATAGDTLMLVNDGTYWREVSRTVF